MHACVVCVCVRVCVCAYVSVSVSILTGLIKQFLRDVDWGEVDYLIIDTPPGTSDEHLSAVQYLSTSNVDGAVIVTTPQVGQTDTHTDMHTHSQTPLVAIFVVVPKMCS